MLRMQFEQGLEQLASSLKISGRSMRNPRVEQHSGLAWRQFDSSIESGRGTGTIACLKA